MKNYVLNSVLFCDKKIDDFKKKIIQNKKMIILTLLTVFIVGLFSYCFIFLNPSYSHDGLGAINQVGDDNWKIALGRYLQPLLRKTRGFISVTWVIGILSFIYLSCSSFIVCKIFDFKEKISTILVSSILTLNMSLALTFLTYSHEADMFCFSLLLASSAVYILKKYKNGFLLGSLLVALSLGLYQAYLSITICLIMLLTIKYLLQNVKFKNIGIFVLKGVIMTLLGGILYYIGLKTIPSILNISLAEGYNSINNISSIALSSLFDLIKNTYTVFEAEYKMVFQASGYTSLNICVSILILTCLILLLSKRKIHLKPSYYLYIVIIIYIYPIFANISGILSNGMIHSLMTYSCYLLLLLPIIFYENTSIKIKRKNINLFKYIICFILIFMLYKNVLYTNVLSLKKYFNDKITLSTMTRVIEDVENLDQFVIHKTPIYFIGSLNSSPRFVNLYGFEQYSGIGMTRNFNITYQATYKTYLIYNFAYPIIDISYEQVSSLIPNTDEFIYNMPYFPQKGYVQYKNGIVLVKLSG